MKPLPHLTSPPVLSQTLGGPLNANAVVDYVTEQGVPLYTIPFYDPGLDVDSWLCQEQCKAGSWRGPHFSYGCGRRL